ncbi:MAG: cellulase family glycosylhydrolase [Oscillospiraceae bacterium]|nr:cellulase family glycosylhydrolase [Oscillospiraceae bacterium]
MKNFKKRAISILLACVMLISVTSAFPAAAGSESKAADNNDRFFSNTDDEAEYDIFDGIEILCSIVGAIVMTPFEKAVFNLAKKSDEPEIFDFIEILTNLVGVTNHKRIMPPFPPTESPNDTTKKAGGAWKQLDDNTWMPPESFDATAKKHWSPAKADLSNWVKQDNGSYKIGAGVVETETTTPAETTPPLPACDAPGCDGKCRDPITVDFGTILPKADGVTADFRNLTAKQLTNEIRAGWNLGNTFDGYNKRPPVVAGHAITADMTGPNIRSIETQWLPDEAQIVGQSSGRPANETRQSLIKEVKRQGFDAIRIPVTWFKVADPDKNLTIHPNFMKRIKTVVDWAYEEGMYIILNTHHEEYLMPISTIDKNDPDYKPNEKNTPMEITAEDRELAESTVERLWEQIAEEFKDYNERLIFEGINEPRTVLSDREWMGGFEFEREMINNLTQIFVDTVRATGGNNRYRVLMVPTYAASSHTSAFGYSATAPGQYGEYKMPTDIPENMANGKPTKIALSIHAYLPTAFALNGTQKTFNINRVQDTGTVTNALTAVKNHADRMGVPVVLGEWGSPNQSNTDDRATHARFYVGEARKLGMPTFWWDNGAILPPRLTDKPEHTYALFTRQPVPYIENTTTHISDFLNLPKIKNSILCGAGPVRPKVPAPLGSAITSEIAGESLVYGVASLSASVGEEPSYTIYDFLEILQHLVNITVLNEFEKEVYNLTNNINGPTIFDAIRILEYLVGLERFDRRVPNFPPLRKGGISVDIAGGVWVEVKVNHFQPPNGWNPQTHWNPEKTDLGWVEFDDGTWGIPEGVTTTVTALPVPTIASSALATTALIETNTDTDTVNATETDNVTDDTTVVTPESVSDATTTVPTTTTTVTLPATVTSTVPVTVTTDATTVTPAITTTVSVTSTDVVTTTVNDTTLTTLTTLTETTPIITTVDTTMPPIETTTTPTEPTTTVTETTITDVVTTVPPDTDEPTLPPTTASTSTEVVSETTVTTAAIQGNVIYDMQKDSDENLNALAKVNTSAGFLRSAGSSTQGTLINVNTNSPKTITVTGRSGTSQGIQVNIDEIAAIVKTGYAYVIEYTGYFPNDPTAVARIRSEYDNADDKVVLAKAAAVNGSFTVSVARTAEEIKADGGVRYSLGNESGNIDIIYTGIRIIEFPWEGSATAPITSNTPDINTDITTVPTTDITTVPTTDIMSVTSYTDPTTNATTPEPTTPVITTTTPIITTTVITTTTVAVTTPVVTTPAFDGYTITFNANGGTLAAGSPTSAKTYPDSGKLPTAVGTSLTGTNAPTRSGYTFAGWFDTSSSSGGNTVTFGSSSGTIFTGNATIYARWTANPTGYTITFDHNYTGKPANILVKTRSSGEIATADFPEKPTRSGYTFVGWFNTSATSGGTEIKAGSSSGTIFTKDETVYARWSQESQSGTGPYGKHGKLKVQGANIVDKNGNVYQLYGMSTHGINDGWYPKFVNKDAFKTLRDDWNTNCIRLAMYTGEYNGYAGGNGNGGSSNNKTVLKNRIKDAVSYADELGMYVIIDWHILADNNPNTYLTQAKEFFGEMSKLYKDHNNILYEICNEPNGGTSWSQIKTYANEVIPVIRANNPDAIIIVGTPTWSQDIHTAQSSPLSFSNVMYTMHFYADTHKATFRTRLENCMKAGFPIYVTEFAICSADGAGSNNTSEGQAWLDLLNKYNVSYNAWSLSNKNETSAVVASGSSKLSGWSDSDLSTWGKWIRTHFKSKTNQ